MAIATGSFSTYTAIGNREDLADMVYDISPTETPLMSNVKRGSANHTLVEWQTDVLATAVATNAVLEGNDASTNTATPTVRFGNYCQISDKVPRVTGTQDAMNSAGRRKEMSYQIAKRGKELKRDIESSLCSGRAGENGSALTARSLAGLGTWMWTNQVKCGTATASVVTVASGVPTTAVIETATGPDTVTEADLKSAIASCWTQGGEPNMVLCGATDKQVISGFSGIATQYRENPQTGPATIIGAADVYVSDFGTVNIVPSRFMAARNVYVLDSSTISVKYLRPIAMSDLAKDGDSTRKLINAEYTLCVESPRANATIHSTTNA